MKGMLIAGPVALAIAASAATALAQSAPNTCYLQVGKLMADRPEGVGDLRVALRQLGENLRPQVEEVNQLRAELEQLRLRQREAMQSEDGGDPNLIALQGEAQRVSDLLEARQAQLKQDFDTQRAALVEPVQQRVNARAQAFASRRGCSEMKMARSSDISQLQAAAAKDVTVEFIAWYDAGG